VCALLHGSAACELSVVDSFAEKLCFDEIKETCKSRPRRDHTHR
jgi:hypothetical protein